MLLPRSGDRRGVAFLMVLVCVIVGIVMASAALTSNDNVNEVADNAVAGIESKWAAESAMNLTVAALQTDAVWADGDKNLLSAQVMAGGTAAVIATDLEGNVPDAADVELLVTAQAQVNGVESTSSRIVRVTPSIPASDAVDGWLSEFSAFAGDEITIEAGAVVSKWDKSPRADGTSSVKLGVGFSSTSSYKIDAGMNASCTEVYADSNSSTSLRSMVVGQANAKGAVLPVSVPRVSEKTPLAFSALVLRAVTYRYYSGAGTSVTMQSGLWDDLFIDHEAVVTLDAANGEYWSFDEIGMNDKAVLRIVGNVKVLVRDDLYIAGSATVELADANSKLTLYLKDDMTLDDGCLGVDRAVARNNARSIGQLSKYTSPARVRVASISSAWGGKAVPVYSATNRAIVCGTIHAPTAQVEFSKSSILVGRVSASKLYFRKTCRLASDPCLDAGVGFTNLRGPLYGSDGQPVNGLVKALSLYDVTGGVDGLVPFVATLVAPPTPPSAGAGVTPRTASRATSLVLPKSALKLEGSATANKTTEVADGSLSGTP